MGYLIPWTKDWEVGPYMGAAIILGLKEIQKRQLLPGYKVGESHINMYYFHFIIRIVM